MDFDVVVVGAGLGGLAAGALLAKKGLKVHLIEQHDKVGGYATNFKRKKYRMEVAIHVLDGDHKYSLRNEIFDKLDVRSNVEFVKLPQFYTCHFENNHIAVPDAMDEAREHLSQLFPHQADGLKIFFQKMYDVNKSMHTSFMRRHQVPPSSPLFRVIFQDLEQLWHISIGTYIDSLFNDDLLKMVLLANSTFYHDNPYEMNLMQYMASQASYFLGGVYYVKGGSQVYSDYLAKIIKDHGGQISLNHAVEEILVENGVVTEVLYRKTRGDEKLIQKKSSARYFVMNAAIPQVYAMIKGHTRPDYVENIKQFKHSTSATTLFYGLKKPLKHFGNNSHLNIFVDARANMMDFSNFNESVGVIDYDVVETGLCQPGVYSCDLLYMDKMINWQSLSPEQYKEKKKIVGQYYTKKLNSYFPGMDNEVDVLEVGTPKTIYRYTSAPGGACYGFSPEMSETYRRTMFLAENMGTSDPHLKNLYFGSAWSYYPGFSGAQIGGAEAAKEVLKKESIPW